MILDFNGGTNIVDKYQQVISAGQLTIGDMLDAYYDKDTYQLTKLQISTVAWEYKGVVNWSMDDAGKILKIADTKYKYTSDLVIIAHDNFLSTKDLDETDELIVKGYDREIWSIIVSQGHGSLKLEDYDDFIGGTAYIGNNEILTIVPDMVITAQEGTYDVTLEKGSLKGTKTVVIKPLTETVLNMSEFKKPPVKTGMVRFQIKPEGADLYIDDVITDYEDAMELEYGEHTIKVALGGYTTYTGKLDLEESSKIISIDLAETDNSDETDSNTKEMDSGTTDTDNSTTNNSNSNSSNTGENTTSDNNTQTGNSSDNTKTGEYQETNAENNIYIEAPKGASAYFDGVFRGTVPVSFGKETGTHYITLIQSGHKTKTYTVEIEDDGKDVKYTFDDLVANE